MMQTGEKKRNEGKLRDLLDNIKHSNIRIIGSQKKSKKEGP